MLVFGLTGYANGAKDRDLLAKLMTPQQIGKERDMTKESQE